MLAEIKELWSRFKVLMSPGNDERLWTFIRDLSKWWFDLVRAFLAVAAVQYFAVVTKNWGLSVIVALGLAALVFYSIAISSSRSSKYVEQGQCRGHTGPSIFSSERLGFG